MDNYETQQNKALNKGDNPNPLALSETAIFKDNPDLAYLHKKTEKLVSALYLLSSLISDQEPIKWQMREAGTELLSHSLSLASGLSTGGVLDHLQFISTGLKFLSFLEVSYVGGIISEMNYSILKNEFESLIKTAEKNRRGNDVRSLVFPENFFEVGRTPVSAGETYKGHNILSDRLSLKKPVLSANHVADKQKDKNNRQDIILDLLKKNKELGIKDFAVSIKDCSEKTVQRELSALVSKGLVRKEGEKRWSRYMLK